MSNSKRCLVFLMAGALACAHIPTEQERQGALIHYDLGVQLQQNDPQQAFREFEMALKLDPQLVEAHNAIAILLHLAFKKVPEAENHYLNALRLRPDFSEAKTNLANLYLDTQRFSEAVSLYEQVLNDMLYPTPYIARGNLGWAYFKMGQTAKAIDEIRSAVTLNPKFCQGYRNLGLIYSAQGNAKEACRQFGRFREQCADSSEAMLRDGQCLMAQGQREVGRSRLEQCVEKAKEPYSDDCRKELDKLSQ